MVPWLQANWLMSRTLVLVGVLCAGCPAGGDDHDVDGGVDSTGLTIGWATTPVVPGQIAADRTVQDLRITYSSVQLVGDAAPADERTSTGTVELDWDERGAPAPLTFPEAPPGVYSTLALGASGGSERVRIEGQIDLGAGGWRTFEIEDEAQNAASLPLEVYVRAGEHTTLPVELDVAAVLAPIDFSRLPTDGDGTLELHAGDPQMPAVRTALRTAVHVAATPLP